MNNKRWYCAMIICFVSISSKGITLDWAKHNASDSILEYNLKRINVRSCALDNPLIELINRVALSKHFMNFSIQFVRTDIFDDPLVLIADECTSSIFEKRKEFVGVFIANNSYNYFVKADSGMLWRQYFKYAEDEERIEFRQIHIPDSVYIVLPDIRSVCLAKIGEKSCKILYCEIDGKVQEEDEKFMELFQYTHYMSCHFSHLFVTAGTGVQPHKYGAKELDRENGLDLYDSPARWYDPLLARTTTQDPLAEKYRHLSPYAWCAGNPMKYIDPNGKKVELYATSLPGSDLPLATHTFITIRDKQNKVYGYYAFGSEFYGIKGSFIGRLKQMAYDQDQMVYDGKDSEHIKAVIEITPPKGMTESEFDKVVESVAKSFGNNNSISYFFAPSTADMTKGNRNTSTSTILLKSGVSQEQLKKIKELIPCIAYGFSIISRPWTEHEQKEAVKRQQQANFLYDIVENP